MRFTRIYHLNNTFMKIVLSILMLSICVCSLAQNEKKWENIPQGTVGFGVSFQKFDDLNSRIANNSKYESLKDYTGTLQLGWLKERNRVISDFGVFVGSSLSGDSHKKSSVIRYIGLGANIGYDLLESERYLLYPLAGVGYQWYQAKMYTDNSSVPFDEILESPESQNAVRSVGFKNSFFTYNVGFGFAIKSAKSHCGSIGLKATYTGSFQDRTWKSNENQELGNAPKDGLSQFNVGLVFAMAPMKKYH